MGEIILALLRASLKLSIGSQCFLSLTGNQGVVTARQEHVIQHGSPNDDEVQLMIMLGSWLSPR